MLAESGDGSRLGLDHPIAVKEAVLPFRRFRTVDGAIVDSILGPEMRSTGEVMGIDVTFPVAFAKAELAADSGLPTGGTVFVSVADREKRAIVLPVKQLVDLGFTVVATGGTAAVLARYGIAATRLPKYFEAAEGERTILDDITERRIDLVINVPSGRQERADGYEIRAAAVAASIPLMTTVAEFTAAVTAIESTQQRAFDVRSLQDWA